MPPPVRPARAALAAAVLLASNAGVCGYQVARTGSGARSFRSIVVPDHMIAAPREAVSSLPANLSEGELLAYVPKRPVTADLFLFLPGSWSECGQYSELLETIGAQMYSVCLPYDNRNAIAILCGSDGGCYPNLRLEAYNGSFGHVGKNNIESRLASALAFLSLRDGANWSSYLGPSAIPVWSRIRVAGHSQGAGHAALIGYYRVLARVVQFSGVCDVSDWTQRLGPPKTPADRFYGLASRWDVACSTFRAQVPSWKAEGAVSLGSETLNLSIGANLSSVSLGGSHTVISDLVPPGCDMTLTPECFTAAHDSTAKNYPGGSPYARGVWQALCGV